MSVGIFQSICLDYPDLFGQFAMEIMAVMQEAGLVFGGTSFSGCSDLKE